MTPSGKVSTCTLILQKNCRAYLAIIGAKSTVQASFDLRNTVATENSDLIEAEFPNLEILICR